MPTIAPFTQMDAVGAHWLLRRFTFRIAPACFGVNRQVNVTGLIVFSANDLQPGHLSTIQARRNAHKHELIIRRWFEVLWRCNITNCLVTRACIATLLRTMNLPCRKIERRCRNHHSGGQNHRKPEKHDYHSSFCICIGKESGYLTSTTGTFDSCTTLVATDPIIRFARLLIPRVPMMMVSQPKVSTASTIDWEIVPITSWE